MSFWKWLSHGSGGKPGYKRILNRWLAFHLIVGIAVALIVSVAIETAAQEFLLPLTAVLVGLSFAWGGNAQAVLQTREVADVARYHPGGLADYVYTFQLGILIIVAVLVVWAMAAVGVFDHGPILIGRSEYFALKSGLFSLLSITIRVCWHVVLGSHGLLLIRAGVEEARREQGP